MSTIPSTSDAYPSHSVVGRTPADSARGNGGSASSPGDTAVVLLNRSSRLLRREYLAELVSAGFREIVSVEESDRSYTVESLSREFDSVRFILVEEPVNPGQAINLAMHYVHSAYAVVVWSTMTVPHGIERAIESLAIERSRVCVAPVLRGERSEALPTVHAPAMHRSSLRIVPLPVRGDGGRTIVPFDYVALYRTERFRTIGGYDAEIAHPFWQKLDFGFRIHLFGGDIPIVPLFRVAYRSMPEPEDQTIDESYARFYAKNLAIRVHDGETRIPRTAAVAFAIRSRLGVTASIRTFQDARRWLESVGDRITVDPRDLVEEWSVEHE